MRLRNTTDDAVVMAWRACMPDVWIDQQLRNRAK